MLSRGGRSIDPALPLRALWAGSPAPSSDQRRQSSRSVSPTPSTQQKYKRKGIQLMGVPQSDQPPLESRGWMADVESMSDTEDGPGNATRDVGSIGTGFQMYDDSLPASSQPQTPRNLPEARHRSRLLGAFTAPVTRHDPLRSTARSLRYRRAWAHGRSPSPEGLNTPGFRGLYGGRENADDAALFEQALRRLGDIRRSDGSSEQ